MKFPALCLLLLFSSTLFAADAPRKIAFGRGSAVWVANLDGSAARKVATGSWPDISPDGTRLAYTVDEPSKSEARRHVAVVDLGTGKTTILKDVPSNNCYGSWWSPDGSKLVFNIWTDNDWHIGLINADGTGFRYLKKATEKGHSLYPQCWARDGQSIFAQDLDAIYQLGVDGEVQKKWPLKPLIADGDMNSGSRMSLSPDGRTLLVEVDQNEEPARKDWDGPQPAIWSIDLAAGKAVRLTGRTIFAWEPRWMSDTEFLCTNQPVGEKEPSIYRASADGKSLKPVLKNARTPSVSF